LLRSASAGRADESEFASSPAVSSSAVGSLASSEVAASLSAEAARDDCPWPDPSSESAFDQPARARPSAAIPAAGLIAKLFVFIVLTVTANLLGACVAERSLIWAVEGVSNRQVLTCELLFAELGF